MKTIFKINNYKNGNSSGKNVYTFDDVNSAEEMLFEIALSDGEEMSREVILNRIAACLKMSTENGVINFVDLQENYSDEMAEMLNLLKEIGNKVVVVDEDDNEIFKKGEWRYNDRATASLWIIEECEE